MSRVVVTFACPRCGYQVDAATGIRDQTITPVAGDLSLCLWCAAPLEFQADGPPRWLTFKEFTRLPGPSRGELLTAMAAICTMRPSRVRFQR